MTADGMVLFIAVLIINLPFGYWREGTRKFSTAWFVAVHGPIPVIILLRYLLDVDWQLSLLPLTVLVYFSGQYIGGFLWRRTERSRAAGQS